MQTRLSRGGVFCQWIPVYDLGEKEIKSIIKTFIEVFPYSHIFIEKGNLFILGSEAQIQYDYQLVNARLLAHYSGASLSHILNAADLLAKYYLFSSEIAREYSKDAQLNTDIKPVVEYSPRHNIAQRNFEASAATTRENLFAMIDHHKQSLPIDNLGSSEAEIKKNIANILEQFASRRKDFTRLREQN